MSGSPPVGPAPSTRPWTGRSFFAAVADGHWGLQPAEGSPAGLGRPRPAPGQGRRPRRPRLQSRPGPAMVRRGGARTRG